MTGTPEYWGCNDDCPSCLAAFDAWEAEQALAVGSPEPAGKEQK